MSKVQSLQDIMSEEYAQKLQHEFDEQEDEDKELLRILALSQQEYENSLQQQQQQQPISEQQIKQEENNVINSNDNNNDNKGLDEDYRYALKLQQLDENEQYDEEDYDEEDDEDYEEDYDDDANYQELKDKPGKAISQSAAASVSASASAKKEQKPNGRVSKEKFVGKKEIITKHDLVITGKLNAVHLDEKLASNFGNLEELNMPIPNAVYSTLKMHAERTESRRIRYHGKEDRETREHVMDPRTRILLYKLLNSGLLSEVGGILSSGKEANVYLGLTDHLPGHLIIHNKQDDDHDNHDGPRHAKYDYQIGDDSPGCYAIKIYKTTLNEFKNRDLYLKYDYRFRHKHNKQNPRKFISVWAEKERDNLLRLKKAALPVPDVILLRKHILLLQFIGDHQTGVKAPHLRDAAASLSVADIDRLYRECVMMMRVMFQVAKLVHADLSEYNLLYYQQRLWVIDLAQAVEHEHPFALAFLKRDCDNINHFFESAGASFVMSSKELFLFVLSEKLSFSEIVSPVSSVLKNADHLNTILYGDVIFDDVVLSKKNVKSEDKSVEEFWCEFEKYAKERGVVSDSLKSEDEIFLNGFLPRKLTDVDDSLLPSNAPFILNHLNHADDDDDDDDENENESGDVKKERRAWEERPKLSKDEQKLLRKEAKKKAKESKRSKRQIPSTLN